MVRSEFRKTPRYLIEEDGEIVSQAYRRGWTQVTPATGCEPNYFRFV